MVKFHDLEDLAEPPLWGNQGVMTSDHPKDEAMDLDGADGFQDNATAGAQFSPREVNFSLV